MLASDNSRVTQLYIFYIFQILSLRLLHGIEYGSLCYTLGPCWLAILHSNLLFTKFQCPFKSAVDSADSSLDSAEVVYPARAAEAHVPVLSVN